MNLPGPKPLSTSEPHPVISTYSILLLSGMLFGICVSGNVSQELKAWMALTGCLGLLAYLVGSFARNAHVQSQQRIAAMQVEQRLDRHSSFDLRAEDLRLDQPAVASERV